MSREILFGRGYGRSVYLKEYEKFLEKCGYKSRKEKGYTYFWKDKMTQEKQKPLIAKIEGVGEFEVWCRDYVAYKNNPATRTDLTDNRPLLLKEIRTTSDLKEVIKWLIEDEDNRAVDCDSDVWGFTCQAGFVARDKESGKYREGLLSDCYSPFRLTTKEKV